LIFTYLIKAPFFKRLAHYKFPARFFPFDLEPNSIKKVVASGKIKK